MKEPHTTKKHFSLLEDDRCILSFPQFSLITNVQNYSHKSKFIILLPLAHLLCWQGQPVAN